MRRKCQHRGGPFRGAQKIAFMKLFERLTELFWRRTDLVHGYKAVVGVAGCVFEAFGHHWPSELLELQREQKLATVKIVISAFPVTLAVNASPSRISAAGLQQDVAQEMKDTRGCSRIATLGP